jgi:flavin-dependent dehydrogenase
MDETREALEFDVLFVGGGPANLAGAIHLMNMAQKAGKEIEVCLIEKAESIGSHSLSGAILDPVALQELMPDFLEKGCPIEQPECQRRVLLSDSHRQISSFPTHRVTCTIVAATSSAFPSIAPGWESWLKSWA